ncbi:MAG TPA: hypothetical protein VFL61_17215 [Gaiellaceae bacterium]|nr:hypothetical protein [Gaiellaceae bacterium]
MPELPPPSPPETRTSGQLVAEAMRLYGRRFWAALALGVGPLAVALTVNALPGRTGLVFLATGGAVVFTVCYVVATLLAGDARPARRSIVTALTIGVLVFAPVPFLTVSLLFPGLIWLAFFGLAVPVALNEEQGIRQSVRRSIVLARADFVHALGSLAALVIVGFISAITLAFLLGQFGEQSRMLAAVIPLLLVSPLLFLGSALLYFDQSARLANRT